MTQPPNQPPPGGFGAPQDPSSNPPQGPGQPPPPPPPSTPPPGPGYGYPQQPPTAPGYGYPQQPSGPNPYTQPQQPGPYNQPTQPYGQPQQPNPYGYPTQPQYPGAPGGAPGGGGRNPFKGKPQMLIGAVVAVMLVAGGVAIAVTSGGDDDKAPKADGSSSPSASKTVNPGDGSGDGGGEEFEDLNRGRQPGDAKVLWYKGAPDAPGKGAKAEGMWITDTVAVKAAYKQLFGYRVNDGKPAWSPVSFPQEICATSRQASSSGKIVVAYKDGLKDSAKCNQLVEVDLKTGQKGWTTKLGQGSGLFDSTLDIELGISHDTLIVGRSQSGSGLSMKDGKELWMKERETEGSCFPHGFTGGSRVILSMGCAAGKSNEHDRLEELDPATGHTKWKRDFPKGWKVERVFSTDPLVVYLTNKDKKQWNISILKTSSGATRSQVAIKDSINPQCPLSILRSDLQGCSGVAVDKDHLYLPTDVKVGANEVVAVSLESGKESWRVKSPSDTNILPLKTEGGNVIVYQKPSYDRGGAVLAIPTEGDHKPKKLLQHPESAAAVENSFFTSQTAYEAGRFYISTTRLTGSDKEREKLMMAFGN